MNSLRKIDFNVRQICLTAYRALLLLKYLMVKPLSEDEVNELFSKDIIVQQALSSEHTRLIINSLKQLGCIIKRPRIKNNHKFELLENPFCLSLSKNEINVINRFRKKPIGNDDLEKDLNTNFLINKICLLINDEQTKDILKSHNVLNEIDYQLIYKLKQCCEDKDYLVIKYLSGRNLTEFEMIADILKYEKDKLYIWGYSPKYKDFSYLRVDKIRGFKVIKKPKNIEFSTYTVRYKMFDLNYFLDKNETLIEKNDKEMIIDYKIENEFKAIQKFLELGNDCKIISPEGFKQNFINTLKSIKEVYIDG